VNGAVQYVHAHQDLLTPLPQLTASEQVFLAGLLFLGTDSLPGFLERLTGALKTGDPTLPPGMYCGCLVTPHTLWLFKTRASNSTVFYLREDSGCVQWSTNPRDLVTVQHLNNDALLQCCLGIDAFVYTGIESVAAGTVVRLEQSSLQRSTCDPLAPTPRLRRMDLLAWASSCREALLAATRPLALMKCKVGAMLSGGIDSAVVVAALAQQGVDLVAYHLQYPDAVADESAYARAVCQALDIPFVALQASSGAEYLSAAWRYPHPYGHAGFHSFELVAERAQRDGITLLVTGRGGDPSFGPLATYGVSDVLTAPISLREKGAMMLGAISTDWLFTDLLKSLRPAFSLIDAHSLASPTDGHDSSRTIPFLRQSAFLSQPPPDLFDVTCFSPQDLTVEAAIWQPHGICVAHPYHAPVVQQLVTNLPAAYRLLPFRGMRIVKPVLLLAFADVLPPLVVRHRPSAWLNVPHQEYCLHAAPFLLQLLGSPTSRLVRRGILDPVQLRALFTGESLNERTPRELHIRSSFDVLIACAMTEFFLRQFDPELSADAVQ